MRLFGALAKRVHQRICSLIEQRPQGRADNRTGVIERQVQTDLAGFLAQRFEHPDAMQLIERAFLEIHLDRMPRHQRVASYEMLAETALGHTDASAHMLRRTLQDFGR